MLLLKCIANVHISMLATLNNMPSRHKLYYFALLQFMWLRHDANDIVAISIRFVLVSSKVRRHNTRTSGCRKLARRNIRRTGSPRPKGCSRSTSPRKSRISVRRNLECRFDNLFTVLCDIQRLTYLLILVRDKTYPYAWLCAYTRMHGHICNFNVPGSFSVIGTDTFHSMVHICDMVQIPSNNRNVSHYIC